MSWDFLGANHPIKMLTPKSVIVENPQYGDFVEFVLATANTIFVNTALEAFVFRIDVEATLSLYEVLSEIADEEQALEYLFGGEARVYDHATLHTGLHDLATLVVAEENDTSESRTELVLHELGHIIELLNYDAPDWRRTNWRVGKAVLQDAYPDYADLIDGIGMKVNPHLTEVVHAAAYALAYVKSKKGLDIFAGQPLHSVTTDSAQADKRVRLPVV